MHATLVVLLGAVGMALKSSTYMWVMTTMYRFPFIVLGSRAKMSIAKNPDVLIPEIVGGDFCISTLPHSLPSCVSSSQCGAYTVLGSSSSIPCEWFHVCSAVQGDLLNADSVRDRVCVVALTVVPISVLPHQLVCAL